MKPCENSRKKTSGYLLVSSTDSDSVEEKSLVPTLRFFVFLCFCSFSLCFVLVCFGLLCLCVLSCAVLLAFTSMYINRRDRTTHCVRRIMCSILLCRPSLHSRVPSVTPRLPSYRRQRTLVSAMACLLVAFSACGTGQEGNT